MEKKTYTQNPTHLLIFCTAFNISMQLSLCTNLKLLKSHSEATVLLACLIQQCCGMLKVADVGRIQLQEGALLHEDVG